MFPKIDSLFKDSFGVHKKILALLTGNDEEIKHTYFADSQFISFEEECFEFQSELEDILDGLDESSSQSEMHRADVTVKLPRIELPFFDGNYDEWTSFKDLFTTLIGNKESLNAVEKLHYLKCSVKGEAAHLLSSFKTTKDNFDLAWRTLSDRYENKAALLNIQFKKLINGDTVVESANSIRGLLDKTVEAVQLLEGMNVKNLWHAMVVFLAVQRFPAATRALWEQEQALKKEVLSLDDLKAFLNTRFRTLEATSSKPTNRPVRRIQSHYVESKVECAICRQQHKTRDCNKFVKANPSQRFDMAKHNGLCLNCLVKGHRASACPTTSRCFKCKGLHHTMLHKPDQASTSSNNQPTVPSASAKPFTPASVSSLNSTLSGNVLLATALVTIVGKKDVVKLRALLDQGSQASFITEEAVQRSGLRKSPSDTRITGIGRSSAAKANGLVQAHIRTIENGDIPFEALVLPKLTSWLPAHQIQLPPHSDLNGITLADPTYHTPGRIDLLLGSDLYGKLLLNETKLLFHGLLLQQTKLGWVISGNTQRSRTTVHSFKVEISEDQTLSEQLKRFWQLEEPTVTKPINSEDARCESFYKETTTRDDTGRFVVRLPFKNDAMKSELGNSRRSAEMSLHSLERRFNRDANLKLDYIRCMDEYISNGHLSKVDDISTAISASGQAHFLPHHAVQKDSSTTKTRIVFDASRKTTSGLSLNDTLLTGPPVQNDMISVLVRWRLYKYAFAADIEKMYLQIKMHLKDRDFQRILWRFHTEEKISEYRFNTVIFGVTSAPFLAIRTLHQLAQEGRASYPLAAETICHDFYVDDVLSGGNSHEEVTTRIHELNKLLTSGGFHLRKWVSNDTSILQNIPSEDIEAVRKLDLNFEEGHKSLGILWYPGTDSLAYRYNLPDNIGSYTKRLILSDISRLYDPLGWIAPIIITAKCLMQKLWMRGLDWDESLPNDLMDYWNDLRHSFQSIKHIKIPRCILLNQSEEVELHGFCDASQAAYGAAVYCVTRSNDNIQAHLVIAKVAPVKPLTIPRLELCGALLLSKVMRQTHSMLADRVKIARCYLWTDSKIVISWLQGHPSKWVVFVSNRVCQILENVPNIPWKYVPSEDNPADIASRGTKAEHLTGNSLWWNGPEWLRKPADKWPAVIDVDVTDLEAKPIVSLVCLSVWVKESVLQTLISKCSLFTRLIRVVAYCLRFCQAVRKRNINGNHLSVMELDAATNLLIRFVQETEFPEELHLLRNERSIDKGSKLNNLNPFLDGNGVLRLGSRLAYANMAFDEKYPIILPKDGNFSRLLIEHIHRTTMHGDIQLMLSTLRKKYWILDARNMVKKCVHNCVKCYKVKAQTATQLMGSLPSPRVNITRPFLHVGVDYCGPVSIKNQKGRGCRIHKGYISIFICMATKAVHIELVNDLSTEAFLAAFRRFVSRRGLCSDVYSDCGTNFVGADAELQRTIRMNQRISEYAANEHIHWHFNPPASPHFGGLWEAGVKSMKQHLKKTLGNAVLTFEELYTTLTQIEAALNSRPLCPMYDDPSEPTALTPAHFLIGDSLLNVPESNMLDIKDNRLSRWQYTQKLAQMFWQRWSKEYLARLHQRPKWQSRQDGPKVGDLCLIKDERLPSYKWPLARITAVHTGKDNLVRVVSVFKNGNTFQRNITKIALLPTNESVN